MSEHKPGCFNRIMRQVAMSADGHTRYGICAGCGVRMMERLAAPKRDDEATLEAIQKALGVAGDNEDGEPCQAG